VKERKIKEEKVNRSSGKLPVSVLVNSRNLLQPSTKFLASRDSIFAIPLLFAKSE
jgi:hypothetical protein